MMRQKLITLDPTSWDLAQKKPNFSAWVRQKLAEEEGKTSKGRRWSYYLDVIVPEQERKAEEESE